MNIDLRLLRAFAAVAEDLHFGRAARRLHVSQPSLSRAVRDLERELGGALFARTSREVRLTTSGKALKEALPPFFTEYERILGRVREAGRGHVGELRVVFLASATNAVVPSVVRAFRESYPGVALTLEEALDDAALEGVLGRRFDVALVRTRRRDPELAFARLAREPLCVVVAADHRLARRRLVRFEDLQGEGFVLWPRGDAPESFDSIAEGCRRAGFVADVAQEASGVYTILALVAAGIGVSVLAGSYRALRGSDVVFVPLAGRHTALYAAWRSDDASPARRNFVAVARNVTSEPPGVS